MQFRGPAVVELSKVLLETMASLELMTSEVYEAVCGAHIESIKRVNFRYIRKEEFQKIYSGAKVQIMDSNSRKNSRYPQMLLSKAIDGAKYRVCYSTPYFVPPLHLEESIIKAARRGVEVIILSAGLTDVFGLPNVYVYIFDKYIQAGVKIFTVHHAELHIKQAIVDSSVVLTGSFNFDNLSFTFNNELKISIIDPLAGTQLEKKFFRIAAKSRLLKEKRHSPFSKMIQYLVYSVYRYFATP